MTSLPFISSEGPVKVYLYLQSHCATLSLCFSSHFPSPPPLQRSGTVCCWMRGVSLPGQCWTNRIDSSPEVCFSRQEVRYANALASPSRSETARAQSRSNDSHYVWVLKHENVIRQTGDDRLRASHSCRPGDRIAEPRRGAGVGPGLAEHPKNRGESFEHGFELPD